MTAGLDVGVGTLGYLNHKAETEGEVWCHRASTFCDFLVGQHGEPAISQAMLTHLARAAIVDSDLVAPRLAVAGHSMLSSPKDIIDVVFRSGRSQPFITGEQRK